MKLASLSNGSRDGALVVVNRALTRMASAASIAPTLQAALDDWERVEVGLRAHAALLEAGNLASIPYDATKLAAPLSRVYDWVDASAFLNHVRLVRRARNAEPPKDLETNPLIYQGGGSEMLPPTAPISADEDWGPDFEAEVCVVLGDTPRFVKATDAHKYVRLIAIANDVSLRRLIPGELAKGFGFFQSKPATALGPVVATPDELGDSWSDGRVHLRLKTWLNDELVGDPDAGSEMHFSFFQLIEYICRTRAFTAGTILGSGTVSNEDPAHGISCLAERRMIETIASGEAKTPYLKDGDRVEIEMFGSDGGSLFGRIAQTMWALHHVSSDSNS